MKRRKIVVYHIYIETVNGYWFLSTGIKARFNEKSDPKKWEKQNYAAIDDNVKVYKRNAIRCYLAPVTGGSTTWYLYVSDVQIPASATDAIVEYVNNKGDDDRFVYVSNVTSTLGDFRSTSKEDGWIPDTLVYMDNARKLMSAKSWKEENLGGNSGGEIYKAMGSGINNYDNKLYVPKVDEVPEATTREIKLIHYSLGTNQTISEEVMKTADLISRQDESYVLRDGNSLKPEDIKTNNSTSYIESYELLNVDKLSCKTLDNIKNRYTQNSVMLEAESYKPIGCNIAYSNESMEVAQNSLKTMIKMESLDKLAVEDREEKYVAVYVYYSTNVHIAKARHVLYEGDTAIEYLSGNDSATVVKTNGNEQRLNTSAYIAGGVDNYSEEYILKSIEGIILSNKSEHANNYTYIGYDLEVEGLGITDSETDVNKKTYEVSAAETNGIYVTFKYQVKKIAYARHTVTDIDGNILGYLKGYDSVVLLTGENVTNLNKSLDYTTGQWSEKYIFEYGKQAELKKRDETIFDGKEIEYIGFDVIEKINGSTGTDSGTEDSYTTADNSTVTYIDFKYKEVEKEEPPLPPEEFTMKELSCVGEGCFDNGETMDSVEIPQIIPKGELGIISASSIYTTCEDAYSVPTDATSEAKDIYVGIKEISEYYIAGINLTKKTSGEKNIVFEFVLKFANKTTTRTLEIPYSIAYYTVSAISILKLDNADVYNTDIGYDTLGTQLFRSPQDNIRKIVPKESVAAAMNYVNGIGDDLGSVPSDNGYQEFIDIVYTLVDIEGILKNTFDTIAPNSDTYPLNLGDNDAGSAYTWGTPDEKSLYSDDIYGGDGSQRYYIEYFEELWQMSPVIDNVEHTNDDGVIDKVTITITLASESEFDIYDANNDNTISNNDIMKVYNSYDTSMNKWIVAYEDMKKKEYELEEAEITLNEAQVAYDEAYQALQDVVNSDYYISLINEYNEAYDELQSAINNRNVALMNRENANSVKSSAYISWLLAFPSDKQTKWDAYKAALTAYNEANSVYQEYDSIYQYANNRYKNVQTEYDSYYNNVVKPLENDLNDKYNKLVIAQDRYDKAVIAYEQAKTTEIGAWNTLNTDYDRYIEVAHGYDEMYTIQQIHEILKELPIFSEDSNIENEHDVVNSQGDNISFYLPNSIIRLFGLEVRYTYNSMSAEFSANSQLYDVVEKDVDRTIILETENLNGTIIHGRQEDASKAIITYTDSSKQNAKFSMTKIVAPRPTTSKDYYENGMVELVTDGASGFKNSYSNNEYDIPITMLNGERILAATAYYLEDNSLSYGATENMVDNIYGNVVQTQVSDVYIASMVDVFVKDKTKYSMEYGNSKNNAQMFNIYTPLKLNADLKPKQQVVNQTTQTDTTVVESNVPMIISFDMPNNNVYNGNYANSNYTERFKYQYYLRLSFDIMTYTYTDRYGNEQTKNGTVTAYDWIGPLYGNQVQVSARIVTDVSGVETILANKDTYRWHVVATAINQKDSWTALLLAHLNNLDIEKGLSGIDVTTSIMKNITNKCGTEGGNKKISYYSEASGQIAIINRIYDFRITDITDLNFKNVFRSNTAGATNEHTGKAYHPGLYKWESDDSIIYNNFIARDASQIGTVIKRVLPVGPYKNDNGTYVYAPKMGYRFSFDLKATGAYDDNNYATVKTRFYYISKDGNKLMTDGSKNYDNNGLDADGQIKLFYKNSNGKYVELTDNSYKIYFTPDDGYRSTVYADDKHLSSKVEEVGSVRKLTLKSKTMSTYSASESVNTYYGEYKLPNSTIAVKVDANGTYNINDPLKNGYLGVIFDIEVKTGDTTYSYSKPNTYDIDNDDENDYHTSEWDFEGYLGMTKAHCDVFNTTLKLEEGIWKISNEVYKWIKGTVILYDLDNRAASDFE